MNKVDQDFIYKLQKNTSGIHKIFISLKSWATTSEISDLLLSIGLIDDIDLKQTLILTTNQIIILLKLDEVEYLKYLESIEPLNVSNLLT